MSVTSGCGSDGLTAGKVVDSAELYWALELNHRAVALEPAGPQATYDTLTLVATPRTIDGAPLPELPAATYVSGNPEKVAVTSDGLLQGIAPTDPGEVVPVVATLTAGNLKHVDTALVTVLAIDPRPLLTSFSIHPVLGKEGYADSAKVGGGASGNNRTQTCFALPTWTQTRSDCAILLPVTVLDATGVPIAGAPVAFGSSDKEVAWVSGEGIVYVGNRAPASQVTLYASTTIFGITKADTLPFQVGWPILAGITVNQTGFDIPVFKVGVGAMVSWNSDLPFAVDVNFADPTNVAKLGQPPPSFVPAGLIFFLCTFRALCDDAGDFVLPPGGALTALAARRFPVPGTYDYSSTALGASGRIVVVDER